MIDIRLVAIRGLAREAITHADFRAAVDQIKNMIESGQWVVDKDLIKCIRMTFHPDRFTGERILFATSAFAELTSYLDEQTSPLQIPGRNTMLFVSVGVMVIVICVCSGGIGDVIDKSVTFMMSLVSRRQRLH